MSHDLLIRDVLVANRRTDVLVRAGVIDEIGPGLRPAGVPAVLDGEGGALFSGLHDHHLHLLATAAARTSVSVGPPEVTTPAELEAALRAAAARVSPGSWVRAVGYHESVAGELDRHRLDAIVGPLPVRVQHRTGALWVLSSAALDRLDPAEAPPGAERDAAGRLTGRVHRGDAWLRAQLDTRTPDLAALGRDLARHGITGVTDATPVSRLADLDAVTSAAASGALPQRVMAMTAARLADATIPGRLATGPVKVILDDHDLPSIDELAASVEVAHRSARSLAVHCVTRTSLVLALSAWEDAGSRPGDRIEHGSVIPPELVPTIARLGLTVVTQPGFVAERGDQYLIDVDPDDVDHLYPCGSLIAAGVAVAGSSDAPYTDIDPWAAMRAAVSRTTRSGRVLVGAEAISVDRALALYLGDPRDPGGRARRVEVGATADMCLLDGPLPTSADQLDAGRVVATIIAGEAVVGP